MAALSNPAPLQPATQSYPKVPEEEILCGQGLPIPFPRSTSTTQAFLGACACDRTEPSNGLAGESADFMVEPLAASRNILRSGLLVSTLVLCDRELQPVEDGET